MQKKKNTSRGKDGILHGMNGRQRTGIVLLVGSMLILQPVFVSGGALEAYLSDQLNTPMRVEVVKPYDAHVKESSFWGRLRSLIGIRRPFRIQPAVGTTLIVQSSAYAPSPYQTNEQPCITAAGTRVRHGVVASNFLPMGTELEINGEKYRIEDRMNPRYDGYYIDIWFPSTSSALEFGRRNIEVTVTGYGTPGDPIREQVVEEETEEEPEEDEDTKEKQEETKDAEEEEEERSLWDVVRERLAFLGSFLGIRQAVDVDRFDVNCF
jgi:3D (Asp-Asp-Asp) domain-containing protein